MLNSQTKREYEYFHSMIRLTTIYWKLLDLETGLWSGIWNMRFYKIILYYSPLFLFDKCYLFRYKIQIWFPSPKELIQFKCLLHFSHNMVKTLQKCQLYQYWFNNNNIIKYRMVGEMWFGFLAILLVISCTGCFKMY